MRAGPIAEARLSIKLRRHLSCQSRKNFVELANVECQKHHSLWLQDDFDYPTDYREIEYIESTEFTQSGKITRMDELQIQLLQLELMDDNEEISENQPTANEFEILIK